LASIAVIGALNRTGRTAMKTVLATLAGAMLAALSCMPAQAQGVPPGSYRQSCSDAHIERGALVATCRGEHGGMTRSSLADVGRCTGDIGNNNGVLQCNYASGPARGTAQAVPGFGRQEPGFAGPRYGEPAPGYAPPAPGYGQREGFGERRLGEERYGEGRERCVGLRREAERLRDRMAATSDPYERGRIEGRLREVREQEERCR
jgi:hypothetical protein